MRRARLSKGLALLVCLALGAGVFAPWLASRDGARFFDGDRVLRHGLADAVARRTSGPLAPGRFGTGSDRFDGEWVFGTYLMASLGFGHVALEEPSEKARSLARMTPCIERLLTDEGSAFDTAAWHEVALEDLDEGRGHAAYLGYLGVALGLHRRLDPSSRFAELHDRIALALARRLEASPVALIETYPNEAYPVDVASTIATIALAARARGESPDLEATLATFRARYVDRASGLLVQSARHDTGEVVDGPRGSGTALAAYFLAFADPELARSLDHAVRTHLADTWLGFGVVREYPRGREGHGDIDSGPIVLGASVAATGFSLAGARIFGDRDRFVSTYGTAHLFGAPLGPDHARGFVAGGPLGDAILFAMLTAPRLSTLAGTDR